MEGGEGVTGVVEESGCALLLPGGGVVRGDRPSLEARRH